MALNKSKGNMYDFVTHTWNTVKGECPHKCSYCYMEGIRKRFNKECKPPYFDESELKTNLGTGSYIFVGSSNDLFAKEHPEEWILKTLKHCEKFDNRYLFQSKNPARILEYIDACVIADKSTVCTTIETNRYYYGIMNTSPLVSNRAEAMNIISEVVATFVTIEPIINFDLDEMVCLVRKCKPKQVNIGADSGHSKLPEPSKEAILELIAHLETFTVVKQKANLKRLLE
jgi:DNA repair photolyase